ncbi:hypothetical protein Mapa_005842 [Marchantia paleacea]|nr:hypothetical protein Mapa_005842 [Marchantia paleacea]
MSTNCDKTAEILATLSGGRKKDFSRTLESIPVPNREILMSRMPGFCPFSTLMLAAGTVPLLSWKCNKPLGKMKASPFFTTFANSLFGCCGLSLLATKPV